MAATLSLFPIADHHQHFSSHFEPYFKPKFQSFSITIPKFPNSNFTPCFSNSQTSDNSSTSPSISQETQKNPSKFLSFLTNNELKKLDFLQNYTYSCKLSSGYLCIRAMNDFEIDSIVELLAESFAESMLLPNMYLKLLGFLVKQYLIERRSLIPHTVTLIGFFRLGENFGDEIEIGELSGTVEISFDGKGANSSPPTPIPPKNCPYICNMTVKKEFRRRGIGWHLLKASEELVSSMSSTRDVYLHCRLIDTAPFTMYKKAGYEVVKTDSFLILLTLQRRKHLMRKSLPNVSQSWETVITEGEEEERPSVVATSETETLLFNEVVRNSPDIDK
ncbi:hypothetical protein RND81_07G191200 [Saponaria officinalis]|uniref:N-acetyltransferase domain-containing protein n=1 Tax=Saponaria officinalis TaxID=3572 RepID=A0AAW1JSJ3_SAPOF